MTWAAEPPVGGSREFRPRISRRSKDSGLCWPKAESRVNQDERRQQARPEVGKTVVDVIARAPYPPRGLEMTFDEIIRMGPVKFKNIGQKRPETGRQLQHTALENKLQIKASFSAEEWLRFGITDLMVDDFVRVDKTYFRPDIGQKYARDDRGLGEIVGRARWKDIWRVRDSAGNDEPRA